MSIRAFAAAFTLSALPLLTGCGEMGPGEHLVFRVGLAEQQQAPDCFDNDVPESIAEDDTSFLAGATLVLYIVADESARLDSGSLVLEGEGDGEAYAFEGDSKDVEPFGGSTIWDADHDGIDDSVDPVVDSDLDGLDDEDTSIDVLVDVDADTLDDRLEDNMVDADNDGEDDRSVQLPSQSKLITTTDVEVDLTVDGDVVTGDTKSKTALTCTGPQCATDFQGGTCTTTTDFEGVLLEDADVAVSAGGSDF